MIALPFQDAPAPPAGFKFRVLMNQYDEELRFTFVDDDVPNRGLTRAGDPDSDQFVVTLDYQQKIAQVAAEDRPDSGGLAGAPGLPIHHEPGLWLYEKNRRTKDDQHQGRRGVGGGTRRGPAGLDPARQLRSRPRQIRGAQGHAADPARERVAVGPVRGRDHPGLRLQDRPVPRAVQALHRQPVHGDRHGCPGFPGFSPADMNEILRFANQGVNVVRTTTLTVDTDRKSGGITNVPFSVREAEPVSMKSTFWIQELAEKDETGKPKLRLQYSQVVMLHFFHPREDEFPGRAVWPHISIATLEKVPADYQLVPS